MSIIKRMLANWIVVAVFTLIAIMAGAFAVSSPAQAQERIGKFYPVFFYEDYGIEPAIDRLVINFNEHRIVKIEIQYMDNSVLAASIARDITTRTGVAPRIVHITPDVGSSATLDRNRVSAIAYLP